MMTRLVRTHGSRIALLSMALAVAAIFAGTGCSKKQRRAAPPAVPVLAAPAIAMDVPVTLSEIGTIEAYNSVAIIARVGGQLIRVAFTEGQDVNKGDLLFQIDPGPYEAALAQAQADLERDQAKLVNAQSDVARYKDLAQKDYITQQQYEAAISDAAAAKATVEADQGAVDAARLNLGYCTIRAPIAGRTGNLLAQQGTMVKENGDPLVTINQIVPVYVSFTILEERLADVRQYSQRDPLIVTARPSADSTHVYQGKLTFINNAVDESTGTILLKATFPNEDRALWPGQFARVDVVLTTEPNAVVIPAAAVQTSQQGDYVYVVKADGTAELRNVVQGTKVDDRVVIQKGVQVGEEVVTDGQLRLTPGAKVAIKTGLLPGAGGPSQGPGSQGPGSQGPGSQGSGSRQAPGPAPGSTGR